MREFIRNQFDKILLVALMLIMVGVVLHASHDAADKELVSWARELTGTIVGALLGLITGKMLASGTANIERSTVNISEKPDKPTP